MYCQKFEQLLGVYKEMLQFNAIWKKTANAVAKNN